jgi:putative ABC transport system permease protein
MDPLAIANITQRPGRAFATAIGIAVGVVSILVTVGLARGMLRDSGQRESRVGAELLFQPPGGFGAGVTATPLSMPVDYAGALKRVEGVRAATPVGRYVQGGAGGLGFELIEGVAFEPAENYASYPEIAGIRIVQGRAPASDDELVVDRTRLADHGTGPGSTIELLGRSYQVVGVYEPDVGARIKMRLSGMQSLLGNDRKASWILVKTNSPEVQEQVAARIDARFPGNQIIFTRDIPSFYEQGMPSLSVFLRVVVGLAVVISSLVTLLAMYTAVTERTREIGILKSLGASKPLIVGIIAREALVLSMIGVAVGVVAALMVGAGIMHFTSLQILFEPGWLFITAAVALAGGQLGSLYPALRAAKQDPVRALAYE